MKYHNQCYACWEEETTRSPLLRVSGCGHRLCRACFQMWLKQCERECKFVPNCPDCKEATSVWQAAHVLGRAYDPTLPKCDRDEESLESELQVWLEHNGCKQCGNCGAYIEREEGCDAVMCLCGYRFCWECNVSAEDGCDCFHEDFYDNVRGFDTNEARPIASAAELVDLKDFITVWKRSGDSECSSESGSEDESDDEEFIEDAIGVFETSVLDYEEQATVYVGSIFEYEETERVDLVPMLEMETSSEDSQETAKGEEEGNVTRRPVVLSPTASSAWTSVVGATVLGRAQTC